MSHNKKTIFIIGAAILILAVITVYFSRTVPKEQQLSTPTTFRQIPGITDEEILEVEKVLASNGSFTFSTVKDMECFFRDDGSIGGYSILLCDWLSQFFGVPFTPIICDPGELSDILLSGACDFSGDFTPASDQADAYTMTDMIDLRSIKYARLKNSLSLDTISSERPIRYVFIRNTVVQELTSPYLDINKIPYIVISVNNENEALKKLKSGEADVFIADRSIINAFYLNTDIETGQFSPLLFKRVSITTANTQLKPIIEVLDKLINSGGLNYLKGLYLQGHTEFIHNLFIQSLNETEMAYYDEHIQSGQPIPYGISAVNFPVEYYDTSTNEWAGISVDILKEITRITDLAFQPANSTNADFQDVLDMLSQNKIPMAAELLNSTELEGRFLTAHKPYGSGRFALISRKVFEDISVDQIFFYRVGLTGDTRHVEWLPQYADTSMYKNTKEGLLALEQGEIDLLMTTENRFVITMNYLERSGYKINLLLDDFSYSSFGFNNSESTLQGIISKAQALIDTERIIDNWRFQLFDYQEKLSKTQNVFLFWLTISLLVTLGLFIWLLFQRSQEAHRLSEMVAERTHELQEQTEAKTNFLATMSHEMRTPMNAVIGFSEILLAEKEGLDVRVDNQNEILMKIHNAGRTLLSLINDILDISKIESGKFEIISENYTLPSFINDTITLNITRIGNKPIKFILDIDESLPSMLYGDELRLKQICNNLLSNAFKYTKEGEVVWRISCEREAEEEGVWMNLSVRDTGIGIREEDLNKLFSEYGQLDTKSNRRIEGTGLGLSLTKKMVELMGGSISVESKYGKGSVFTVRILQKHITDIPIGDKTADDLRSFRYNSGNILQNIGKHRIQLPYAKILVVDDVRTNLEVAKGLMKPYGMQVDCVTSGADAIEAIRQEKVKYSAIFMDHMMPEMDGIDASKIIREIGTDYAKNIPIIMLTANAITGNDEMFLSKGFQAFLSKPINVNRLDAVIQQWVRDKTIEEV